MKHKILEAMRVREDRRELDGRVEIDDAYLGGELVGGARGRGSDNKVPIVVAVQTTAAGHPVLACLRQQPHTEQEVAVFAEDVFGDQRYERIRPRPKRCWLVEDHTHGVRVDLLQFHVQISAACDGGGVWICREPPVEDDIVGGEGRSIVPLDALLQLPRHGATIGPDATVFAARNFCREDWQQHTVTVPARQRLVEQV